MSQVNSKDMRKAIKAFISHVESLEKAENPDENGFEAEYKLIQEAQAKNRRENVFPMDVGKIENNLKKNRYKDILPYDEHRVVLSVVDGDQDSDYINASKLMGVQGVGGYIATQGPLASTVNDFWRMIWEYNVEIIFMACRIVELGKIKCKQYWNDVDKSEEYGDITVITETEESIMSDCMRRNFRVTRGEEVRHMVQFHYSGWPDHGIPDDAGHIRDMIGIMRQTRHNIQAPLLVHCSAGCGRSGAIITIDYVWTLLEEGKFDDTFSLFDLICNFREQRMSIVQTADQYALVNKVLKTLCEEWLTKMASHTYENVDVDQASNIDGQITDASNSVSGQQIHEEGHIAGNHVQDGVSGLNQERSPAMEKKQVDRSEGPPVSPAKKKATSLTTYENVFQNEGKNQNLAEKGSHKTVIQIDSSTKLGSPGNKKTLAPSPPSSPLGSDPKGGCKQPSHAGEAYQNTVALSSNVPKSALPGVALKRNQPAANGMPDEHVYSLVNKCTNLQASSTVDTENPKSPTAVYNFASVPPGNDNSNSSDNKKALKAPIPPPQPLKPILSADEYGYSSIDNSFPGKSPTAPTSGTAFYSHLHQTTPSLTADSSAYCTIGDTNTGSVSTTYEDVRLPTAVNKRTGSVSTTYEDVRLPTAVNKHNISAGMSGGRYSNTNNSCLTSGQVNPDSVPGFNKRLRRVRGPVPMPQSWNKI